MYSFDSFSLIDNSIYIVIYKYILDQMSGSWNLESCRDEMNQGLFGFNYISMN